MYEIYKFLGAVAELFIEMTEKELARHIKTRDEYINDPNYIFDPMEDFGIDRIEQANEYALANQLVLNAVKEGRSFWIQSNISYEHACPWRFIWLRLEPWPTTYDNNPF